MNKSKIFYFVTAIPPLIMDVILFVLLIIGLPRLLAGPMNIVLFLGVFLIFEIPLILFIIHGLATKKAGLSGKGLMITNLVFGIVNLFFWFLIGVSLMMPVAIPVL